MSEKTKLIELRAGLQDTIIQLKEKPGTAEQLAKRLKCSVPTVYARLAKLREHGYDVKAKSERIHKTGPESSVFRL